MAWLMLSMRTSWFFLWWAIMSWRLGKVCWMDERERQETGMERKEKCEV
jgi:hypothetical protein